MREFITLGVAPTEEDCVQVSRDTDYYEPMMAECRRYRDALRVYLGDEPAGARLSVKMFRHDFGTYAEVVVWYVDNNEDAIAYAYRAEANLPQTWEDCKTPLSHLP